MICIPFPILTVDTPKTAVYALKIINFQNAKLKFEEEEEEEEEEVEEEEKEKEEKQG